MNLGIIGATGAVGQEFLQILTEKQFNFDRITLFGSHRSAGDQIRFNKTLYTIEEFQPSKLSGIDCTIWSAGARLSRKFIPEYLEKYSGIAIDNSSAFRLQPDIPLYVPGVNDKLLEKKPNLVSVPNCSAIILISSIYPIHLLNPIKQMIVSTYQAVSGAGYAAMVELEDQLKTFCKGRDVPQPRVFKHQIANNVFSHDSNIEENGLNVEENKVVSETRKIFNLPNLPINITCIRVPIFRAHSESIYLELRNPVNLSSIKEVLQSNSHLKLVDDRENNYFPMPIEASGIDQVLVGRLRADESNKHGLSLFVSGDQLRKGAALTAYDALVKLTQG